ncbi:50S ribosomal protein L19 [Candidatus Uhrbacteria bacterium RIFCSPHIGHO2_12_FULL_57_11]|uniref:50S ribosomal protein L19 n=2 Tax=Candidatus Uhriibacteriota TaxID=1752732 RepID=A0A1F7UMI1_9BACT|nr:MAG: 50S ribosomal protein L19 [Candidatus Uhrbacteria bacterium RIFCSPHIGHO2_02_FULL_57_19]OGL79490.1 MAG: 50S ribosomal protein L19 [Candidatus Uhrbacteria bacterium RIFCSPHIGHO2_12_FULL_57_11]
MSDITPAGTELKPGMTVRVHNRIVETTAKGEEKERIQIFEGIILGLRGGGQSRTFTIRKISHGIGVERIFPINSPMIAKIEAVRQAHVRRAKLGYLRTSKKRLKETAIVSV